jgi:hypothetical protein
VLVGREDTEEAGDVGDVTLGGRAVTAPPIDGGRDLITEDRFSGIVVGLFELLVRTAGSLAFTLVVRDRTREAGDCGSRVEVVRLMPDSGAGFGAEPVSAASASALASLLRDVSCVCDRTDGALPRPPAL